MNITRSGNPALLLIDIQKGFDSVDHWGGQRNNPDAEKNAAELLAIWRENDLPVFHIQHCSLLPDSPLNEADTNQTSLTGLKSYHLALGY